MQGHLKMAAHRFKQRFTLKQAVALATADSSDDELGDLGLGRLGDVSVGGVQYSFNRDLIYHDEDACDRQSVLLQDEELRQVT